MDRLDIAPDKWMEHARFWQETYQRMTNEGVILAARDHQERLNPMTIGWGLVGAAWSRPVFSVLVRPSRYTYECIEHSGDYTVNVLPAAMADVAWFCGTKSGRSVDKMAEMNLTEMPSKTITSSGITQASIIYECRVVQQHDLQTETMHPAILDEYYSGGDLHRIYCGQILRVSVDREFYDAHG